MPPMPSVVPPLIKTNPTFHAGYYMYLETSPWSVGTDHRAQLASAINEPTTNTGGKMCLTWGYHMYGLSINKLNVYIRQIQQDTLIWTRYKTQGNEWKRAMYSVTSGVSWQVGFEPSTSL